MSRLNPIWTAGRLNEALTSARRLVVLAPDGRVWPPAETEAIELAKAVGAGRAAIAPQSAPPCGEGMVLVRSSLLTVEVDSVLSQLPPLLSLLPLNPEPFC